MVVDKSIHLWYKIMIIIVVFSAYDQQDLTHHLN